MKGLEDRCILLEDVPQRDYPDDYLVARIRGKRQKLIKQWERVLHLRDVLEYFRISGYNLDSESLWIGLIRRYRWLYAEMSDKFRNIFFPYFVWVEFKTLIICLRFIKTGYKERVRKLFNYSLVSEGIKKIILTSERFDETIKGISEHLMKVHNIFVKGYDIFVKKGMGEYEIFMNDSILEYFFSLELHINLRFFFSYLIDMQNLMSLYKSIKWESPFIRPFLTGGIIKIKELEFIKKERQLALIVDAVRRISRQPSISLHGGEIEDSLLRGLSLGLKRMCGGPEFTGLILYYLWSLYLETRNIGTIVEGAGIDRSYLLAEII